ncbi:Hypothetical protein, putative [Bodo saltans]|uniref:Uncharacterized protein n=1 Tax=Bodo saltans TaxID=75058 RepID=A0A0S4JGX6_BODSA|nr:Hypothetical protein, putative [Bodo saltans]|eukprot:CUG89590.1 Hypothetical protein, putative [Bodo saltans]
MGTCASCTSTSDNRDKSQLSLSGGSAGDITHSRNYLRTNHPQHSAGSDGITHALEEATAIPAGLPRIPKAARSLESETLMTMRTASPGMVGCDTTLEDPAGYVSVPLKRLSVSSPLGVTAEGQSGSGSSMGPRRYFRSNDQQTPVKDLPFLVNGQQKSGSMTSSRLPTNASGSMSSRIANPLTATVYHELHQQQLAVVRDRVEKQMSKHMSKSNSMMPSMHGSTRLGGSTASSLMVNANNSGVAALYHPRRRSSGARSDKSLSQSLKVTSSQQQPQATTAPNPGHSFATAGGASIGGATMIIAAQTSGDGADAIQLVRPVSAQLRDNVGNWLLQQPSFFAPDPIPDETPSDAPMQSVSGDSNPYGETSTSLVATGATGAESATASLFGGGGGRDSEVASPGLIDFGYECVSASLHQHFPVLSMPVFQNSAFPDAECDY